MGIVLDFEDRSIQNIYLFIFGLTIVVIVEAVLSGRTSTLPIFLCEITIGFFLFWSIEFAVREVSVPEKTRSKKYFLTIFSLGRYIVLGCLYYFLIKFLFNSTDLFLGLTLIVTICIGHFISKWLSSKFSTPKRTSQPNMYDIAAHGFYDIAAHGFKVIYAFCIGYFVGRWIGENYGNAEIGGNLGLSLGIVVAVIEGVRLQKKHRVAEQRLQENKEDNNPLRLENKTQSA
jgi:hypothetical protein